VVLSGRRINMRRVVMAIALASLAACAPEAAVASRSYLGFSIGISNAPPPPRIMVVEEPQLERVPSTSVYVIATDPGYDVFRYGESWYVLEDGYWYRASSYNGPYTVVDVRRVPRAILTVPARHWKHHPHGGPPGQMSRRRGG